MYLCAAQTAYKELGHKVHKPTFTYTNSTGLSLHSTKSVFPTLGNWPMCPVARCGCSIESVLHKANSNAVVLCQLISSFFFDGHELSVWTKLNNRDGVSSLLCSLTS